jgi:hypothetical protein
LCFSSFKLLKQNVYNVSNQKASRHGIGDEERNGLTNENSLPLCFSSFEWLKEIHDLVEKTGSSDCIHSGNVLHENLSIMEGDQLHSRALNDHVVDYLKRCSNSELQPVLNHHIKKEEVDQEIVVKGHFPSPETNVDVQQYF